MPFVHGHARALGWVVAHVRRPNRPAAGQLSLAEPAAGPAAPSQEDAGKGPAAGQAASNRDHGVDGRGVGRAQAGHREVSRGRLDRPEPPFGDQLAVRSQSSGRKNRSSENGVPKNVAVMLPSAAVRSPPMWAPTSPAADEAEVAPQRSCAVTGAGAPVTAHGRKR
jgi:hypothetical protein